jgi:hypothetical protein
MVVYNLFQFVGYSYIVFMLLFSLATKGVGKCRNTNFFLGCAFCFAVKTYKE